MAAEGSVQVGHFGADPGQPLLADSEEAPRET